MSVLLIHPGRQHAHQLARALYEQDALRAFWTGVPTADPETKGPFYRWLARRSPQETTSLPAEVVRHNYLAALSRRVLEQLCAPSRQVAWQNRVLSAFDWWAARRIPTDVRAVICYENSARHTFRVAQEQGITTILDAASFHYEWQDAVYEPVESEAVHRRINEQKDVELRRADHILTVSELARKSYVEAGVSSGQVTAVPMGADLSNFAPPSPLRKPEEDPFTFLFAGHAGRRKGADTLLTASRHLHNAGIDHRVQFAGDANDDLSEEPLPTVERLGYLEQDALVEAMQQADVLVLPSRHDSFGRVVVEAMATGLPVIVSENVGAKDVVTEGTNGWVIPADDADSLGEQMQWCARHPGEVAAMQQAAMDAARDFTWAAYRNRVVSVIEAILEGENEKSVNSGVHTLS